VLFFWAKPRKKSILRPHALSLLGEVHARARMLDRASVGPTSPIYIGIYIPRRDPGRAYIHTYIQPSLLPPILYLSILSSLSLHTFLLPIYYILLYAYLLLTYTTLSFHMYVWYWFMLPIHCLPLISTPTHEDRGTTSTYLSFRWCMYVYLLCMVHVVSALPTHQHTQHEHRGYNRASSSYGMLLVVPAMHYLLPHALRMYECMSACMVRCSYPSSYLSY
jgi:hypothetical protein